MRDVRVKSEIHNAVTKYGDTKRCVHGVLLHGLYKLMWYKSNPTHVLHSHIHETKIHINKNLKST